MWVLLERPSGLPSPSAEAQLAVFSSEHLPPSFVAGSWERSSKGVDTGHVWWIVGWAAAFLCPEVGKKEKEDQQWGDNLFLSHCIWDFKTGH